VPADSPPVRRPPIGRPGYTLLAAATVSRLAVNTAPIALVLLVIARTRDGRLAGLLVAVFTVPTLIAGPVLGAYLDQLRRKRLLFTVSQAALAIDLAAGIAGPAIVSAIAGAFGVGTGFGALVTATAVGLPLVLLAPMPSSVPPSDPRASPSLPAAIADGLRLLRQSRELLSVTIATTAGQFFQGPLPVLLPLLAIALGRPASAGGWLLTAFSVGGLAGALASERLIARWSTRPVLLGSLAGLGALLAVLAAPLSFGACLFVAALGGLADGPALAATLTVRQGNVPPDRYAQTLATASSFKIAAFSAGSAVAGLLIGVLTVRQLLLGLAVGQLLSAIPLLLPLNRESLIRNERVVSPPANTPGS
jgi:MFS family permease